MIRKERGDGFGSEAQPIPHLFLQPVYFPETHPKYIPDLGKAITTTIHNDPSARTVLALPAPVTLGVLDIPHFNKWVKTTGKYLDGYIQHSTTGPGDKNPPLNSEELAETKSEYAAVLSLAPEEMDIVINSVDVEENMRWAVQEQHFVACFFFMLDQMELPPSFSLAIQPLAKKDLMKLMFLEGRGSAPLPDDEDILTDLKRLLNEKRKQLQKDLKGVGKVHHARSDWYMSFLQNTIKNHATQGRTQFIVPQTYTDLLAGTLDIDKVVDKKEKGKVAMKDPIYIDRSYYIHPVDKLTGKFARDPNSEVTSQEALEVLITYLFEEALKTSGLLNSNQRRRMIPQVIGRSNSGELMDLLGKIMKPDEPSDEELGIDPTLDDHMKRILRQVKMKSPERILVEFFDTKSDDFDSFDPLKP